MPSEDPTDKVEVKTTKEQFYDNNKLHVDPTKTAVMDFNVPILHGLPSYGIIANAIAGKYGEMKSFEVKFNGPIEAGETLVCEMWKKDNKIITQTKTKERETYVIDGIYELK
jgi:multifunctional beta-oxidation protein